MEKANLAGLIPSVADKIAPMLDDVLRERAPDIHSIHITGSALIPDYNEKLSDVNSVIVLNEMDLTFVEFLAPLGRKYGKKRIAAPLIMTPEYIRNSLDVFPIEFHDFRLIHQTVYGPDIMRDLDIHRPFLRLQAEREIKTKLIGLRQGYISSLGKQDALSAVLLKSFTGSMALFRAVVSLLGKEPPVQRAKVIEALGTSAGIGTEAFEYLLLFKTGQVKPSEQELSDLFERYYKALEVTGKIIDELPS